MFRRLGGYLGTLSSFDVLRNIWDLMFDLSALTSLDYFFCLPLNGWHVVRWAFTALLKAIFQSILITIVSSFAFFGVHVLSIGDGCWKLQESSLLTLSCWEDKLSGSDWRILWWCTNLDRGRLTLKHLRLCICTPIRNHFFFLFLIFFWYAYNSLLLLLARASSLGRWTRISLLLFS